jgi:endo-1,4-beta-xylanase
LKKECERDYSSPELFFSNRSEKLQIDPKHHKSIKNNVVARHRKMASKTSTTLRETASNCCKQVYIGAAILPRPLFVPDFDDDGEVDGAGDGDVVLRRPRIKCATIATVTAEEERLSHSTVTRYAQVLSSEFNSVVIEHHLKWSPLVIHPYLDAAESPRHHLGTYDFHHVDLMVDWATENGMHVKGHALIWHVTSPVSILEKMTPTQVRSAVRRHIFTTIAYFKDRISMWDVVNEALAGDGSLVENVFYRKMGPTYIEECFRWAHEADPDAFLIYNDNKVEGCGCGDVDDDDQLQSQKCKTKSPNQSKADGFYNLLKDLVQKKVPVHGAGMQAHFSAGGVRNQRAPTPSMVKRQIRRIGMLGLKVNISEMDVRVSTLTSASDTVRETAQLDIYQGILTAALSEPAFHGIWFWGFTDRHTWVKNFYYEDTPLIFDDHYERKSCYFGVEAALLSLCPSRRVLPYEYLEVDVDNDGHEWGQNWMMPDPEEEERPAGENETRDTTKEGLPDWMQPS